MRRSAVWDALGTFVAAAAVLLLVHGITPLGGHPGGAWWAAQAGAFTPAADPPPELVPPSGPEEADHDGCQKPGGPPCAGRLRHPAPPSRHGGRRPRESEGACGDSATGPPGAGVAALRWTRPAGPRLPIFRC